MKAALLAMLLCGCATQMSKPGGTTTDFNRDYYACQKDAAAVQYMPRYNRMVSDCLALKGWREK